MIPEIRDIVIADDNHDDIELFQSAMDDTCADLSLTVATNRSELMKLLNKAPAPILSFST
jgi:hypothetical protein